MKTGICFVTLTILLQIFTTTAEAESKIGRGSLTFLGITPGESTFNDVTRAFGRAEARRTGDAGTSETQEYHTSSNGNRLPNVQAEHPSPVHKAAGRRSVSSRWFGNFASSRRNIHIPEATDRLSPE